MSFFEKLGPCLIILIWLLTSCQPSMPETVEDALASLDSDLDFNFDIKPILADRCFSCHGPDDKARKADLRLDLEDHAKATLSSGGRAISNSLKRSELVKHILSTDPDEMMPPPDSKLSLTDLEKAKLIKWIDQGADYKKHWSFIAPIEKTYVSEEANPVDHFIRKKLEASELEPTGPEGPERLLRRLYMDLTGLPPDPQAISAFVSSNAPDKYEQVVDQLLASSDCAERLALEWMDVARYADSHGLHADGWRSMWPWRDYVIKAFQNNMPYDQFVTEQLAGDLLPNPTRDQIVATAFHRNHPMTAEGGAIDEEFRVEYVADRTNTTATAILGLTMECAKCHDHKYDPISQDEYYQMSAFFNNVRELGMTGDDGNYGPIMQLASEKTQRKIEAIRNQVLELKAENVSLSNLEHNLSGVPDLKDGLIAYLPMEKVSKTKKGTIIDGQSKFTSGALPSVIPGKVGQALRFEQEYDALYLKEVGLFDVQEPFSSAVWINTTKDKAGTTQTIAGNSGNKNNFWRGWDFYLDNENKLNIRLINALPDNLIHVRSLQEIPRGDWKHVAFTYQGFGDAESVQLFVGGIAIEQEILTDGLTKNIRTIGSGPQKPEKRSLCIAKSYRGFTGENGIFEGAMDEFRVYERALSAQEVRLLAEPNHQLSAKELASYRVTQLPKVRANAEEIRKLIKEKTTIHDTIPEIMVMEEMPQPRPTFVLDRGEYNSPVREVKPGTPASILAYDKELPTNRLGLAGWLFNKENPLTARVAVNRYWQMIFGRGIVKSANDFGVQGSLPSHPELLDWLALHFQNSNWNLREVLKVIVMSKTYQQSSKILPDHLEKDPDNVLLARSPSYRLPGELIRDNALAASGLLVKKVGGPSVKPYQPEGLWIDKGTFSHKLLRYAPDEGQDLYRRSLYTFVKRTSPHPAMTIFDAPNRDVCTIKREITNTPLQALVLLNDPQFVEASRVLAQRVLKESPGDLQAQIADAFLLLTSRQADDTELNTLIETYREQKERFAANPKSVSELLAIGDWPLSQNNKSDLAAMTIVTNTIMNSDESYTRR